MMTEKQAHSKSDDMLNATTKALNEQYNSAYKKAKDFLALELSKVDLSGKNANERLIELKKYDRLDKIVSGVADIFIEAGKATSKSVKSLAVDVYQLNYDWQAEQFGLNKEVNKTDSKKAYDEVNVFDLLALEALTDRSSLEREIKSKIAAAVIAKQGIRPIISAVKNVADKSLVSGVATATGATTLTENKGRFDVMEIMGKRGHKIKKVWRAVHDNKTREAHRQASGQVQDFDKPFIVGGEKLMYPQDKSLGASVWNTINCRCRMAVIEYK